MLCFRYLSVSKVCRNVLFYEMSVRKFQTGRNKEVGSIRLISAISVWSAKPLYCSQLCLYRLGTVYEIYVMVNTGMASRHICVVVECYGKLDVVRRHAHLPCWNLMVSRHFCISC